MRKLLLHAPLAVDAPKWTDPHTKVNALLQSHFSRASIPSGDLAADQRTVLQQTTRLLQVRSAAAGVSRWVWETPCPDCAQRSMLHPCPAASTVLSDALHC